MPAVPHDITIEQGSTFVLPLTYRQYKDGPLIDLTNHKARMQIRHRPGSPDVLADLSSDTGEIVLGGVDGTITVTISPSVTKTLPAKPAVYDLELEHTITGVVVRLLQGDVVIDPEVTR